MTGSCPHTDCVLRTGNDCAHWQTFKFPDYEDGREMVRQSDCAFNWGPRMLYEQLRFMEGTQQAVESARNESNTRLDTLLTLADPTRRGQLPRGQ